MFDIGFFELLVVVIVGLVVIGPERLPSAIRSGALWWGRLKRSMRETRTELEKQLGADDIRRELHNEEVMRSLEALRSTREDLQRQIKEAADTADDLELHHGEGIKEVPASKPAPDEPGGNKND